MVDLEARINKKYLSVNEARQVLGCSKNKMYKIIKLTGFPKMKIGKNYYIDQKLFEKWQDENMYTQIVL